MPWEIVNPEIVSTVRLHWANPDETALVEYRSPVDAVTILQESAYIGELWQARPVYRAEVVEQRPATESDPESRIVSGPDPIRPLSPGVKMFSFSPGDLA